MAMYSIVKQIGNRSTFQLKSRFSPARNYESRSVTSIIIHHGYLLTSRLQFVEAKWGRQGMGVLPNQRGRRKKINSKINTLVTTGIEKRGENFVPVLLGKSRWTGFGAYIHPFGEDSR
ncbi:hypothetical protein CDAR_491841 [Caerostris darwini]|uniref:Uncharacterized protein n=1 Tax=Caerostris darwini TaxID=1538125 RepID=A0AAV4MZX0_9ARAC|nr:hypothetical protein CDAR_491841 [Caerostris darwini]